MSEKDVGGRPTKYKEEYNKEAMDLCMLGYNNAELAKYFDVEVRTIDRWIHDHDKFCRAIKKGREGADTGVVKSMYKKANGYFYTETKITYKDPDTLENVVITIDEDNKHKDFSNLQVIEVVETKKHMPASDVAAIFWLKNRHPEKWNKKPIEQKEEEFKKPKTLEGGRDLPKDE